MKNYFIKLTALKQSKAFMYWVCEASPYTHCKDHLEVDSFLNHTREQMRKHLLIYAPNAVNDEHIAMLQVYYAHRKAEIEDLYDILRWKSPQLLVRA